LSTASETTIFSYLIESPLSTDVEDYHETDDDAQHDEESGKRLSNIYGKPNRRRPKFSVPKMPCVNVGSALNFDPGDICEDLSDMLPDTTTAFSQLFFEKDKMKVWNDFVHKSEEEQSKILRNCRIKKNSDIDDAATCWKQTRDWFEFLMFALFNSRYSCYLLVDKLNDIENLLGNFFKETPKGIFVHCSESGFERILVHAVSQYLLLKSISFNDGRGTRKTKIFNTYPQFTQPVKTLVSYLKDNFKQSEMTLIEP
uniref:R3H-associated N-terminal domain-containing protein n=1 Tax=Romanomermis culicivorax TaxID=13658 RepID=A0A915JVD3_ROMCU